MGKSAKTLRGLREGGEMAVGASLDKQADGSNNFFR